MEEIVARYGKIDVLFNVAGIDVYKRQLLAPANVLFAIFMFYPLLYTL